MEHFPLTQLRRWPDWESNNLFASDAADRLILDNAEQKIADNPAGTVLTVEDSYGALALGAHALGARSIRSIQDSAIAEAALKANARRLFQVGSLEELAIAHCGWTPSAFDGVDLILMRVPKDLGLLRMIAELAARFASPHVTVIAGAMTKHLPARATASFHASFASVSRSLAQRKARVILAQQPIRHEGDWHLPFVDEVDPDLHMTVSSLPGVFSHASVDIGTRFLLSQLTSDNLPDSVNLAVDLGCGSGLLTSHLLKVLPHASVVATDISSLATLSTERTIAMNGPYTSQMDEAKRNTVRRDMGLSRQEDASVDLIVCNPPFHSGHAVNPHAARSLFVDAARTLKPGGTLITVFNSHLPHKRTLERIVGPTTQIARNHKFTVTKTRKVASP